MYLPRETHVCTRNVTRWVCTLQVMGRYESQFKTLFTYFAKQGSYAEQGGQFSSNSMLSVYQFLMFAKECKLSTVCLLCTLRPSAMPR